MNWFEFGLRDSDDVWFGARWEGDSTQQWQQIWFSHVCNNQDNSVSFTRVRSWVLYVLESELKWYFLRQGTFIRAKMWSANFWEIFHTQFMHHENDVMNHHHKGNWLRIGLSYDNISICTEDGRLLYLRWEDEDRLTESCAIIAHWPKDYRACWAVGWSSLPGRTNSVTTNGSFWGPLPLSKLESEMSSRVVSSVTSWKKVSRVFPMESLSAMATHTFSWTNMMFKVKWNVVGIWTAWVTAQRKKATGQRGRVLTLSCLWWDKRLLVCWLLQRKFTHRTLVQFHGFWHTLVVFIDDWCSIQSGMSQLWSYPCVALHA